MNFRKRRSLQKRPLRPRPLPPMFDPPQMEALILRLSSFDRSTAIAATLSAFAGLTNQEMTNLVWSSFDQRRNKLTVTGNSARSVHLGSIAQMTLSRLRGASSDRELILPSESNIAQIETSMAKAASDLGLSRPTLEGLRLSFAIQTLGRGVSTQVIAHSIETLLYHVFSLA